MNITFTGCMILLGMISLLILSIRLAYILFRLYSSIKSSLPYYASEPSRIKDPNSVAFNVSATKNKVTIGKPKEKTVKVDSFEGTDKQSTADSNQGPKKVSTLTH